MTVSFGNELQTPDNIFYEFSKTSTHMYEQNFPRKGKRMENFETISQRKRLPKTLPLRFSLEIFKLPNVA